MGKNTKILVSYEPIVKDLNPEDEVKITTRTYYIDYYENDSNQNCC